MKPLAVSLLACLLAITAHAQTPNFGPNVFIYSPTTPAAQIQAQVDKVYATQQHSEFSPNRYAFLFLPGEYHNLDIPLGFYTEVIGLGASPDSVHIFGNVHADASSRNHNATTTFWRGVSGLAVTPNVTIPLAMPATSAPPTTNTTMRWAASQAAPFRRMHILGDLILHQYGWASGGWISDSLIDGTVASGPQQQYISRNAEWKNWTGSNWNMVFVGVPNPPAGDWPKPPYTKIALTPVVREKPYLQVDAHNHYFVHVPALTHNSTGITWHSGSTPGKNIPLSHFYLAKPTDTAADINAQLAAGKNLIITPGIYKLEAAINITRKNTVVLGLGFPSLIPTNGTAAITTADADGIIIAGLIVDAGPTESKSLVEVGTPTSHAHHAKNPISLHDIFFCDGGPDIGKTVANLVINSNDTIIDHTWIWRADHGHGVGWEKNLSANGLVVNGDNVTAYGLFVEHHQQYQVLWNGNYGRTYFYQSEIPYDPPTQAAYTSAPGVDGWASYKVADNVTHHEAWGLGAYSVFTHPNIWVTRMVEAPQTPGVIFHDMITVALLTNGGIRNVINNTGGSTKAATKQSPGRIEPHVTLYPAPTK